MGAGRVRDDAERADRPTSAETARQGSGVQLELTQGHPGRGVFDPRRPAVVGRDRTSLATGRQVRRLAGPGALRCLVPGFRRARAGPGVVCPPRAQIDEVLPWEHISAGVTKEFLTLDYMNSLKGAVVDDCREHCFSCGILGLFKHDRRNVPDDAWGCPAFGRGSSASRWTSSRCRCTSTRRWRRSWRTIRPARATARGSYTQMGDDLTNTSSPAQRRAGRN